MKPLNLRQRRMLGAVAVAVGTIILWPPVNVKIGPDYTELSYVSLLSDFDGSIDWLLLIAEILSLCLIGMIAHRMLDDDR